MILFFKNRRECNYVNAPTVLCICRFHDCIEEYDAFDVCTCTWNERPTFGIMSLKPWVCLKMMLHVLGECHGWVVIGRLVHDVQLKSTHLSRVCLVRNF